MPPAKLTSTLSPAEAGLFFQLLWALQSYVNSRLGLLPSITSPEQYARVPSEEKLKVRQALWDDPKLLEAFIVSNPADLAPEAHADRPAPIGDGPEPGPVDSIQLKIRVCSQPWDKLARELCDLPRVAEVDPVVYASAEVPALGGEQALLVVQQDEAQDGAVVPGLFQVRDRALRQGARGPKTVSNAAMSGPWRSKITIVWSLART